MGSNGVSACQTRIPRVQKGCCPYVLAKLLKKNLKADFLKTKHLSWMQMLAIARLRSHSIWHSHAKFPMEFFYLSKQNPKFHSGWGPAALEGKRGILKKQNAPIPAVSYCYKSSFFFYWMPTFYIQALWTQYFNCSTQSVAGKCMFSAYTAGT